MNIHEYQAKEILKRYGVSVPNGVVVTEPDAARAAAQRMGGDFWVVKAQVHAGARGKSGGVKLARSPDEVANLAQSMLGSRLVTEQTGAAGIQVERVYIEAGCQVDRELFLSVVIDSNTAQLTALASPQGGAEVEHLAAALPESMASQVLPLTAGIPTTASNALATHLELTPAQAESFHKVLEGAHRAFLELDGSLLEINPLAVTADGALQCLDIKMAFDDNGLYRQPDVSELRDPTEELDRLQREAHGFNFTQLNGDIGCLVTGAGLALATIDLLKLHGGEPANFLDLPPVATRPHVAAAFRQIAGIPAVRAIAVNAVGGGFCHCDTVAEGLITASRDTAITVPLIIRFTGTSKNHAIVLLNNSGLAFHEAHDLDELASLSVAAARGGR
jgi:succinyl-CoA synthetase beta subunit